MSNFKEFTNGRVCLNGCLIEESLFVDTSKGRIIHHNPDESYQVFDLEGQILAPAFLELQINGCAGIHFTRFEDSQTYQESLKKVSQYLITTGVGSYWATVPTVSKEVFKKVLPQLKPQSFSFGAELLGAHCEGPWLNPVKKGAHDESLMQVPDLTSEEEIYGGTDAIANIKMVTVAPELPGATNLINRLTNDHGIVVSLGHSSAGYDTGLAGLTAGAKALTHVFNAMDPLHHRQPGLGGLISSPRSPYYSIIPDGIHLHPATVTLAYRANPEKCILITDSIEMAGMPDGLYPGHAQIPHPQKKDGNKVTIADTDTLIGSCISLDECVRNLSLWSSCSLSKAIRCATENVARLMGLEDRGILEPGRRADFVVLNDQGYVQQTWLEGVKVYQKG